MNGDPTAWPARPEDRAGHHPRANQTRLDSARGRRGAATVGVAAAAGVVVLIAGLTPAIHAATSVPEPRSSAVGASAAAPRPTPGARHGQVLSRSVPVRLQIPAIGVRTRDLVRLRRTSDGRLEAPERWKAVGWYRGGPWPGQAGAAVVAGHVDSHSGPAVFYRLTDLRPRDRVVIGRADGSVVEFKIYAVERYPKNNFPVDDIYAAPHRPELRLITCGGRFDEDTDSYADNVVAYATMTDAREPPR